MSTPQGMPDLFASFDVTLQEIGERPVRAISTEDGDGGVPQQTIDLVQWLYDTGQKGTFSFKGGKPYFGKQGEPAAAQFDNDAKDSVTYLTARDEHKAGLSVTVKRDGIVVTVSVGKKRGRVPNATNGDAK